MLEKMRRSVSLISHTAWPVNFILPLTNFESHIGGGLYTLINFAQSVHASTPAVVLFCSSISTTLESPASEIAETLLGVESALSMGYSLSKWVGEQIVRRSRSVGAHAYSLRIGQISGHSRWGLWNDSGAIPLLIRSALTLGALPAMDISCAWLPVDQLARSILEIAASCLERAETTCGDGRCSTGDRTDNGEDDSVYNIVNPHFFPWATLLDRLQQHGLKFKVVPCATWLQLLKASADRREEKMNPAVKLIHHYRKTYGPGAARLVESFRMENARHDNEALRHGSTDLLAGGVLNHYVRDWLGRWEAPSATRLKAPRLPARPHVDRV